MKRKLFILTVGAIVIALGSGLNMRYASDDDGIANNSLDIEVLALNNRSGNGVFDSTIWKKIYEDCTFTISGTPGVTYKMYGIEYTIPPSESITFTLSNVKIECGIGGKNQFEEKGCAEFWHSQAADYLQGIENKNMTDLQALQFSR